MERVHLLVCKCKVCLDSRDGQSSEVMTFERDLYDVTHQSQHHGTDVVFIRTIFVLPQSPFGFKNIMINNHPKIFDLLTFATFSIKRYEILSAQQAHSQRRSRAFFGAWNSSTTIFHIRSERIRFCGHPYVILIVLSFTSISVLSVFVAAISWTSLLPLCYLSSLGNLRNIAPYWTILGMASQENIALKRFLSSGVANQSGEDCPINCWRDWNRHICTEDHKFRSMGKLLQYFPSSTYNSGCIWEICPT